MSFSVAMTEVSPSTHPPRKAETFWCFSSLLKISRFNFCRTFLPSFQRSKGSSSSNNSSSSNRPTTTRRGGKKCSRARLHNGITAPKSQNYKPCLSPPLFSTGVSYFSSFSQQLQLYSSIFFLLLLQKLFFSSGKMGGAKTGQGTQAWKERERERVSIDLDERRNNNAFNGPCHQRARREEGSRGRCLFLFCRLRASRSKEDVPLCSCCHGRFDGILESFLRRFVFRSLAGTFSFTTHSDQNFAWSAFFFALLLLSFLWEEKRQRQKGKRHTHTHISMLR